MRIPNRPAWATSASSPRWTRSAGQGLRRPGLRLERRGKGPPDRTHGVPARHSYARACRSPRDRFAAIRAGRSGPIEESSISRKKNALPVFTSGSAFFRSGPIPAVCQNRRTTRRTIPPNGSGGPCRQRFPVRVRSLRGRRPDPVWSPQSGRWRIPAPLHRHPRSR